MKTHTRKLLIIIPLLPLLMGNSPAPQREEYDGLEVTYLSEESLHNYNFYHFNIKNTGDGFVDYLNFTNENGDESFYAGIEGSEICPPFNQGLIEPGFDKEVIVATKNTIPESKKVLARAYSYMVLDTNITYSGSMHVSYSIGRSNAANKLYCYNIQAIRSGALDNEFNYECAANVTYKGVDYYITVNDDLYFTTYEQLDLEQLTVNKVVMLKSSVKYYYNYGGIDFSGALKALLIFLLLFFLIVGFGIFSAIFFPAMARKRRRKALEEQNNK